MLLLGQVTSEEQQEVMAALTAKLSDKITGYARQYTASDHDDEHDHFRTD